MQTNRPITGPICINITNTWKKKVFLRGQKLGPGRFLIGFPQAQVGLELFGWTSFDSSDLFADVPKQPCIKAHLKLYSLNSRPINKKARSSPFNQHLTTRKLNSVGRSLSCLGPPHLQFDPTKPSQGESKLYL